MGKNLKNTTAQKLTVVIACRNRTENLSYCLKSIDYNIEIPNVIVVDFGSSPKIEFDYPWLRVLRVTRNIKFFSKPRAYNIAIKQLNTPYVCFTDADQIFENNFFGEVYRSILGKNKRFVVAKTWRLERKIEFPVEELEKNYKSLLNEAKKNHKLYGDGVCFCVNSNWIVGVRGYDEKYKGHGAHASDIRLRARFSGLKGYSIDEKTSTIHMFHEKSDINYYDFKRNDLKNRKYFLKKRRKYRKLGDNIKFNDVKANVGVSWGKL